MLGFDRRIVLEHPDGERRSAYLLDTVAGHYFVMVDPDVADALIAMQEAAATLDDALEVLALDLFVLDMRTHHFIPPDEVPAVLARSRHQSLVTLGDRLARPPLEPPRRKSVDDDLSAEAFAHECMRRTTW